MATTGFKILPLPRLHTVNDADRGITRRKHGAAFTYHDARGRIMKTPEELRRIKSLAIPPAWTAVWICRDPAGHIQATGRDARGRKQYRYHPDWTLRREARKTGRLLRLAETLPAIRRCVRRDLTKPGLPREKVLALMVKLLELTAVRPGHREYAQQNGSYGLASMKDGHACICGSTLAFRFRGKSGKHQSLAVDDKTITALVGKCRRLKGSALFQYLDDSGKPHPVHAADLNRYLNEISQAGITAKDLRTWSATVAAFALLRKRPDVETARQRKAALREVMCTVAAQLGNTPAICRTSYIHACIQETFLAGKLPPLLPRAAVTGLSRPESAVVQLLRTTPNVQIALSGKTRTKPSPGRVQRAAA